MKSATIVIFLVSIFTINSIAQDVTSELQFEVDGRSRIYYMYVPEKLFEDAPLVFVLHGYGGSAEKMIQFSGMNKVAAKNGFAVCYPQGNYGSDEKNSWNAGYSNDDVDDVKFLTKLAAFLQKKYKLSTQNTFCTGMSNGADMCYMLACNAPDAFAAVAPVAGCMMESIFNSCKPSEFIPIFETHGTDDDITFWMGDPDYSEKYGAYFGTRKVIDFWIDKNQCKQSVKEVLPDETKEDKSYVVDEKYKGAKKENQVWLYTLVGGKHDWPGSWGNMDIVIAEEIWTFFQQFVIN